MEQVQAKALWYAQKCPGKFEKFYDAMLDAWTEEKTWEYVLTTFRYEAPESKRKQIAKSESERESGDEASGEEEESAEEEEQMTTDDGEPDEEPLVNIPISLNTIDSILLSVHNAIAGMSRVTLQDLWNIVASSDQKKKEKYEIDYKNSNESESSSEESSEDDELVVKGKPRSRSLSLDKLETIRSLFSAARRGSLTLSKKTVFNLFVDIENV